MEYIRIKCNIDSNGQYKLISYDPTFIDFYYNKTSGINLYALGDEHYGVDVHGPTYLNYIGDSANYTNKKLFLLIDQVIKQIKRKETINKLLNA